MKKKKQNIEAWIKKHKRILIVGVSSIAMLGIYIALRKKETIDEVLEGAEQLGGGLDLPKEQTVSRVYTLPAKTVDVRQHIRNLPITCHHSQEKQLEAEALGIVLLPNQTIVDASQKYAS